MEKRAEDFLGYWLFYTQRSWAYAFGEALKTWCQGHQKPYVVTPPQWGILSCLQKEDGLTIGTLGLRRGIDPPTVTGIVKRLEQAGLVERVHNRLDRRIVKVYLTEEGRDLMHSLPDVVESFSRVALQDIPEERQREMILFLQKIVANLTALGPGLGDRFGLLPEYLQLEQ